MTAAIHPDYGPFMYNKEYVVRTYDKKSDSYEIFDDYRLVCSDTNDGIRIFNKNRKSQISLVVSHGCVTLSQSKDPRSFAIQNIILMSIFTNIDPVDEVARTALATDRNKTPSVDHIDEDHTNDRPSNLRWMSRSENSRLGQKKSTKRVIEKGGIDGKALVLAFKESPDIIVGEFKSRQSAGEYILKHLTVIKPNSKATLHDIVGRICNVCSGTRKSAYGFVARDVKTEVDIDDEVWVDCYLSPEYKVSNKGRIRGKHGTILKQWACRNGAKYLDVKMYLPDIESPGKFRLKHAYIHSLVYFSFNTDRTPTKGIDVCHDDTVQLVDGRHRNWLSDLTLGSRTENMIQWHAANKAANIT